MVLITIVTGANLNQQTSLGGLTLYQSKLRIITIVGPALLRQGSNMPAKRRPRMATAVFTVDIDPRLRLNKCWLWEYIWSSYIAFIYIYISFMYHSYTIYILVGGAITILKNMSSSMGRMTSHILWKITNVWNHQPATRCNKHGEVPKKAKRTLIRINVPEIINGHG